MASFTVMVRYGAAPRREMQLNWNKECIMCQQSFFSPFPRQHTAIIACHDSGRHRMS